MSHPNVRYGAIDFGTNACRLLVAETEGSCPVLIDTYSKTLGFGRDLDQNAEGLISEEAIVRSLSALEECTRRLTFYDVHHVRCVATEACRKAKNASEFVRRAQEQTGLTLEIIPPEEEARLALSGCSDVVNGDFPYGILIDIGGGSTEIVFFESKTLKMIDMLSLPFGILKLRAPVCSWTQKKEIAGTIEKEIAAFAKKNGLIKQIQDKKVQTICASGTMVGLTMLTLNKKRYDRGAIHGMVVEWEQVRPVIRWLWKARRADLLNHPCVGSYRAPFVLGGAAIMQAIIETLGVETVRVSNHGVREGIVRDLIQGAKPQEASWA